MNDLTFKTLVPTDKDHVLEIGFGGGLLIGRILSDSAARITGVDISELAKQSVTKRYGAAIETNRLHLTTSEGTSLPFEKDTFSQTCCVNVIYFWSDIPAMLTEIYRVLADDGKFAVCYQETGPDGQTKFSPERVENHLAAGGFTDIVTTHNSGKQSGVFHCTIATKPKAE